MGRMNRYEDSLGTKRVSRTEKNQKLYNDLGDYEKYVTLTDVSKIEAVELESAKKNVRTRQGYHQIKDYDLTLEKPLARKRIDEFDSIYNTKEHKTYDINRVIEKAKELREKDSYETKRKLHNEKYNILESSEEELEKFKEETYLRHKPIENEEELVDLINTITSKELREEIDKAENNQNNLLSDLMATNIDEEVLKPIATKIELDDEDEEEIEESKLKQEIDNSFYTSSMELNKEDFELDEDEEYETTSPFITFLKLILSIALIIGVGIGIYYVITNF